MIKFIATASNRTRSAWQRGKPNGRKLCNIFILVVLSFILISGSVGFAQSQGFDPGPPRPKHETNPWPWLLAFVLLGIAWYPAFKNSKREMER